MELASDQQPDGCLPFTLLEPLAFYSGVGSLLIYGFKSWWGGRDSDLRAQLL